MRPRSMTATRWLTRRTAVRSCATTRSGLSESARRRYTGPIVRTRRPGASDRIASDRIASDRIPKRGP